MGSNERREVLEFKVDQLRKRLLEPSTRNTLLSTKFSERSRRHFRVIDELPDELFARLERSLRFRALPPMDEEPKDERTESFLEALDEARLTDETWHDHRRRLDEEGADEEDPRWSDGLRGLEDRVRHRLGLPPRSARTPTHAEHARRHGLDPSWDLPAATATASAVGADGAEEPARWRDNELQLLMLPGEMEARVEAVRDRARAYEQERGVNVLGVAFGFLEWREADGTRAHYAPLMLRPARIERRTLRSGYVYRIAADAEPPSDNETLRARLRHDFGVELPALEPDETPEAYWSRVEGILDRRDGWRVRRWVAVGLFPFENIVITREIENHHDAIVARDLVADILEVGAGPADREPDDGTPAVDAGASALDAPGGHVHVIADADSSQEAAVRAVLAGANLALQGPPGTGKSQTIMNIIGTALHAGKTVLFVAEKKAALEVVANRLREAGLGALCLELHSDGTRPRNLLDSLGESLFHERPPRPRGFDRKLEELRRRADELERYVQRLGSEYGTTGHTVQELFWRVREASDGVELDAEMLDCAVAGPDRISDDDMERARLALEELSRHHRDVFESRGFTRRTHPWRGVSNEALTPLDLDDVRRLLGAWADAVAAYDGVHAAGRAAEVADDGVSATSVTALRDAAAEALTLVTHVDGGRLAELATAESRADLEATLTDVDELSRMRAATAARLGTATVTADELRDLERSLRSLALDDLAAIPLARLGAMAREWTSRGHRVREYVEAADELGRILGLDGFVSGDVEALELFAELVRSADDEVLAARRPELTEPGLLADVGARVRALRVERDELAESVDVERLPSAGEVDAWAARLERTGVFSFLSGAWRAARRGWRGVARDAASCTMRDAGAVLRRAARFLVDRERLTTDPGLAAVAGTRARGIETDLGLLERAGTLMAAAETRFAPFGNADALAGALLHAEARALRVVRERLAPRLRAEAAAVLATIASDATLDRAAAEIAEYAEELGRVARRADALTGLDATLTPAELPRIADAVDAADDLARRIARGPGGRFLPPGIEEGDVDVALCRATLAAAERLAALPGPVAGVAFADPQRLEPLRAHLDDLVVAADACCDAWRELAAPLQASAEFWDGRDVECVPVAEQRERAAVCIGRPELLDAHAEWARGLGRVRDLGLHGFVTAFLATGMSPNDLWAAWRALARRAQVRDALEQDGGLLKRLSGKTHEQARADFARLDTELIALSRRLVKHVLHSVEVPEGVSGPRAADRTERALVEHEYRKKTRYVPVRDLIRRAARTVAIAKPCFMMSPRSVSTYLPIDAFEFDLVVIDEASQMKPEFAIGALARAKQAVIVGDPLQLPPTDFFSRDLDDVEETEGWEDDGVDQESVLDQALAAFRPAMTLRWHYRSRHHSLIAPSNRYIYDGELDLTPAPQLDAPGFGVHLRRVPGLYHAGTNPVEAEAVVDEVLRLMGERPDESVGIVAMNVRQRELIRLELDRAVLRSEAARAYVERWETERHGIEAPFVKNLENVQGDERDVILVSCVYGPQTEGGPVAQRFGPINGAYGHRRLNVLFTRARNQVLLFSSMDAGDVRCDADSARGLTFFRAYLEYAATGRLDAGEPAGRGPESPFERWVLSRLEAHGFEGVPRVGVAGYRIDVGVRHPSWPHGFLCGIECDGATYHSCASTRDRDRLRQQILERLGWDLYRIWSTDWFADPHGETDRLITHLRDLLAARMPDAREHPDAGAAAG